MGFRIGVDVGGSFTDFAVLEEESGRFLALKVFSRPDAPGEEIALALDRLAEEEGLRPEAITYFTHGTTVGVNAVIQRRGDKIALFTTRGFEDVLEMARLKIPHIHDLCSVRPEPLIPREHVFGIGERMAATGAPLHPPAEQDVTAAVQAAREAGCAGIVIAFLHAYRNPAHEEAVAAMIRALAPDLSLVCSSAIWPVIREYERTITTVISAYVQPRVSHYLDRFEAVLRGRGVTAPLMMTKSNGGVMGIAQARAETVQMLLSGTASGVIGAGFLAMQAGFPRILSLDIGGTSADIAVIEEGRPAYGTGETIGDFQIFLPSVSVSSVGQGGGSIVSVDEFGVLRMGPESAGSTPGPACYGRGGLRPTLTDALVVCNLLGHMPLGFGAVQPDREAARLAFAPIAAALGCGVEEAACHAIAISISEIFTEISALVSRFGIDTADFHLFAFGGAGAMMAAFVAAAAGMAGVVVPPRPGVVSALGGLIADLRNDFIRSVFCEVTPDGLLGLTPVLAGLRAEAHHWLYEAQAYRGESRFTLSADMRFRGQSYEVETPLQPEWIEQGDAGAAARAFCAEHARLFGHADAQAPMQLVNLRLTVLGETQKLHLAPLAEATGPAAPFGHVEGWFGQQAGQRRIALYHRADLRAGHQISGPAVIGQEDTTTVLPPGFVARVDAFGNLVLTGGETLHGA